MLLLLFIGTRLPSLLADTLLLLLLLLLAELPFLLLLLLLLLVAELPSLLLLLLLLLLLAEMPPVLLPVPSPLLLLLILVGLLLFGNELTTSALYTMSTFSGTSGCAMSNNTSQCCCRSLHHVGCWSAA